MGFGVLGSGNSKCFKTQTLKTGRCGARQRDEAKHGEARTRGGADVCAAPPREGAQRDAEQDGGRGRSQQGANEGREGAGLRLAAPAKPLFDGFSFRAPPQPLFSVGLFLRDAPPPFLCGFFTCVAAPTCLNVGFCVVCRHGLLHSRHGLEGAHHAVYLPAFLTLLFPRHVSTVRSSCPWSSFRLARWRLSKPKSTC